MISHFLSPSIQRVSRGECLENEVVEYTGDWELDRMELSKGIAKDITHAELTPIVITLSNRQRNYTLMGNGVAY